MKQDSEKVKKAKADLAQAKAGKWRNLKENQAGKGDKPRHNLKAYAKGWDAIFGK